MTQDEQITILRARVNQLEKVMTGWADVMEITARQREVAYVAVVEALVTDWKTAILSDPEMMPEQRDYWLNAPTQEEEGDDR